MVVSPLKQEERKLPLRLGQWCIPLPLTPTPALVEKSRTPPDSTRLVEPPRRQQGWVLDVQQAFASPAGPSVRRDMSDHQSPVLVSAALGASTGRSILVGLVQRKAWLSLCRVCSLATRSRLGRLATVGGHVFEVGIDTIASGLGRSPVPRTDAPLVLVFVLVLLHHSQ